MRIGTLRRGRAQDAGPGVSGTVRLDRRTKNLTKRLQPGDIAVIDHVDIDRVSADALVGCKVAAVVNAAPSISGRYPNLGPEILINAGIPLLDDVGRRSEEHTSELQSLTNLVCRLLLEKKKKNNKSFYMEKKQLNVKF